MIDTANKFTDDAYDFFTKIADPSKSYSICRDPERMILGYKCLSFKKNIPLFSLNRKMKLLFVNSFHLT